MENYNRDQFIKNYNLTKDEFLVLSLEERMEYANQLFGYKVSCLKNIGDSIVFASVINSCFYEYFEMCGCKINQDDLGAEVTEVIKVSQNQYEPSIEAKEKLEKHIKLIAITKDAILEERKRNFYQVKKGRKSRRFSEKFDYNKNLEKIEKGPVANLPAYEQRWLIPVQLENIIKSLDNENLEYLDQLVNDEYLNYLNRNGYQVKQDTTSKKYLLHK